MKQPGNFKAMKNSMHKRDKETQDRLDAVFNLQSNALKQRLLYKHYSSGELPFSSLNEIQIHENELATATTFNVSFQHLLDNDLYLENVYYEKEYSDTGAEYLVIKDLDDVDEISSKDRATILNTRAKMVLGISPSAASFFTLVPKKDAFFYDSYGNTLDGSYDFASMYRNRKLLKLDANTVYVQKPKGSSANREFVKLVELVNLTGVHSMTSLPEFDSNMIVNDLISNEFNGRIMVNLGNSSMWRTLNEATSFILTVDDGLLAMIPGKDSFVPVEFTNTQGINKWVMGGFHSIAGEPTLILVAKDNSNRTRVFYVSIEAYPLLFDGNTIREMLGVDIDGVDDFPIADIQQLIPYMDDTLATFTSGGFLQFNSFKYGFPEKAKEFLTSDTKTDVPNLHRFDSVAKMDMPFIGSLDSGDVQRVSIDSLDRTTITHDFINSSLNLGNGALYWYPNGNNNVMNKVKAKKFGETDIDDSLFWDVSPAGFDISVSKDELVAASTKLLLFLKQETTQATTQEGAGTPTPIAKTLYAFIRESAKYRYQDITKGENWGWGVISDNNGSRKTTIGQMFNTYACTFSNEGADLLSRWFEIENSTDAEAKVKDCTAYKEFSTNLTKLKPDTMDVSLKYTKKDDASWILGDFAASEADYANVKTFRDFINELTPTDDQPNPIRAFINKRWEDITSKPGADASYTFSDDKSTIAEQLTKLFIAKVNMEIGSSPFFYLIKLDNISQITPEMVSYDTPLEDSNVETEAKSLMESILSGISTEGLVTTTDSSDIWKANIANSVVNTSTYFSDWENYVVEYAEFIYGNREEKPSAPTHDLGVQPMYQGLVPSDDYINVNPSINMNFSIPDVFYYDFGDVKFSVHRSGNYFEASSIDIRGASISFTFVKDLEGIKITDIICVYDDQEGGSQQGEEDIHEKGFKNPGAILKPSKQQSTDPNKISFDASLFTASKYDDEENLVNVDTVFELSLVDSSGTILSSTTAPVFSDGNSKKSISEDIVDKVTAILNNGIDLVGTSLRVTAKFTVNEIEHSSIFDFSFLGNETFKIQCDPPRLVTNGMMPFNLVNNTYKGATLSVNFDIIKLNKIFESDSSRRKLALSNMSKYCLYNVLLEYTEDKLPPLPTYDDPISTFPAANMNNVTEEGPLGSLKTYGSTTLNKDNSYYTLTRATSTTDDDKYEITGNLTYTIQASMSAYYYYEKEGEEKVEPKVKALQNELKVISIAVPFTVTFHANIVDSKYEIKGTPSVTLDWEGWVFNVKGDDYNSFQFNTKLIGINEVTGDDGKTKKRAKFGPNQGSFLAFNGTNSKKQYDAVANSGNDSTKSPTIKEKIEADILFKCGVISNNDKGPPSDDDILTILVGPRNDTDVEKQSYYTRKIYNAEYVINAPLDKIPKFFIADWEPNPPPPPSALDGKGSLNLYAEIPEDGISGKPCYSISITDKVSMNVRSNADYAKFSNDVDELSNRYKFTNPYMVSSAYARKHTDEFNLINNTIDSMKFSASQSILPKEIFVNSAARSSETPTINITFVDLYNGLKSQLNKALSSSLYYTEKKGDNSTFFDGIDPILDSLLDKSYSKNIHDETMELALQKVNSIHTKNFAQFDFVENQVPERMYCIKANNEIKTDTGASDIDTPDDAKIFGVVGRKAMSFTESSLCGVISDARIFTEKQVFTPVPYEVKTFPYDIERWEPANTSCTAMVYWLKVPYQEGAKQSTSEYDLPDGTYAYIDDDGLVGFLDAFDISNARHIITNVAYTPSIGKVFFTVSDSNDVYVTDASAMKLKRDRVHKINMSVDCDMFKTRYSGNPSHHITSMFLSDRDEVLRSEGSFKGEFNLVVQFDDNSLHRFTFTNKLESFPYSQVALSNTFADGNLSSAYRQFSGITINDISSTDSGIAVFTGNTYYTFEDGYARKEDVVLYPTLLKSFSTTDNVYTSYYLSDKLVLTCVNTSGPLQDMYPYHQISLPKMIPELYSLIEDNLIVYDVDMTAWSSESTVSYIIMYTNKGVYLVDMGMSPGKLKYDDKQAVIDYFVQRSMSGLEAHLTSKHHDKTVLSRFNNWRRKVSDNTVYDFASLTTNTQFTSPTERHGGKNDNSKISVIVDKQVFGGGTVICSAEENPGVVFAAVQSPITKYDETWKKAQLASPLVDTQFYDYFYRSDTAPNGATLLSGMMNLNHLPFIYRFNTDKTWDMWVNIPSTMTPYMNRVVGSSANIKGGRVKVEGNIAKIRKNIDNVGLISDPLEQATTVRLYINTGHFHMDSITDAVISGSSLPMHVYRDMDANDGLFDGVQMQSVWNRQVQTITDKHGITYAMIEFKVWGADEQSVRLHGSLAVNTEK